jgi:hypothetical protein
MSESDNLSFKLMLSMVTQKMSKYYMNRTEFNEENAQSTGGVTGSKRVESEGISYQLKPSIAASSTMRKLKAGGVERENFGEVIAAEVSRALTNSDSGPELVPKVVLVNDTVSKQTMIASRYLNNVEKGNLDDYAIKGRGVVTTNRHVKITGNLAEKQGELSIGGTNATDQLLRQDLAKAIAVSALSGDHDVNPGNMMAIKDAEGKTRIARIDFGHAFNDLIRTSKLFGGTERNKDNRILDFVNRETVEHFNPLKRETKLWKNYSGIIPSLEMAQAFKEIGESKNLQIGIDRSLKHFEELISELDKNPKENAKQIEQIKKSLIAISENVSKDKIDPILPTAQVLTIVKENLTGFYEKGQTQMLQVSELMEMQVKVDKLITLKAQGHPANNLEKEIKASYKKIEHYEGIGLGKNKGIEWVKNDKDKKAFKGDLQSFIKDRTKVLGHDKSVALVASEFAKSDTHHDKSPHLIKTQAAKHVHIKVHTPKITESIKEKVQHIMKPAIAKSIKNEGNVQPQISTSQKPPKRPSIPPPSGRSF